MGDVIPFPLRPDVPDLQFYNAGCFVICTPETDKGRDWIMDNIYDPDSDTIWPLHIEYRYLDDIVLGARADGLVCHG